MKHSPALAALIDALRILPGVGPKSAQRMAFHLLQEGRPGAGALATSLATALAAVRRCSRCRMLTEAQLRQEMAENHVRHDALAVIARVGSVDEVLGGIKKAA